MKNNNELEKARIQLVKDGLTNYLDALIAIREFGREICRRSREMVERKKSDLADAMGIPNENIIEGKDYFEPDKINGDYDDNYGWIIKEYDIKHKNMEITSYFGITFRRGEDGTRLTNAIAGMEPIGDKAEKNKKIIVNKCRELKITPKWMAGNQIRFC